jgi:hypothetical protein
VTSPRGYALTAYLKSGLLALLHTTVLFALINVAIAFWLDHAAPAPSAEETQRQRAQAALDKYGMDFYKRLYPGKTEEQIRQLLDDSPQWRSVYAPFVEFMGGRLALPGFNRDEAGFRLVGSEQGPWPLDRGALNIFVFGNSTTQNGSADEETIPAHMQRLLRERSREQKINVYNFATGAYFSSQEVTMLQNLLRSGDIPDMVVFIDGFDEFFFWNGETAMSGAYRNAAEQIRALQAQLGRDKGVGWHFVELLRALPFVKLMTRLRGGTPVPGAAAAAPSRPRGASAFVAVARAATGTASDEVYARSYADSEQITDPGRIEEAIEHYLINKDIARGIARQFALEPVFVWQPSPLYKYDLSLHPYPIADDHRRARYGYPVMARYAAGNDMGPNFLWCADVFESAKEPVYVDQMHYSDAGNRAVAGCIVDGMLRSGAFERAWRRKSEQGPPPAVSYFTTRLGEPPEPGRLVGRLFARQAVASDLTLPPDFADRANPEAGGVLLSDDSAKYANLYEEFPIERDAKSDVYEAAILIKSGSSPKTLLGLHFDGATPQDYWVSVDTRTMTDLGGVGFEKLERLANGWYRLTLAGSPNGTGNTSVRVQLYPRHGEAEDVGDVLFGGGELRLRAARRQTPATTATTP